MARIRSVKPEFWSSETLASISRDSRLLFIGLWNFCDDYGCCLDIPRRILGDVFPYDEDVSAGDIKRWIDELEGAGLILRYRSKTRAVLIVTGWNEHQKVDKPGKVRVISDVELSGAVAKPSRNPREDEAKGYRLDLGPRNKDIGPRTKPPLPPEGASSGNGVVESFETNPGTVNSYAGPMVIPCKPFREYIAKHGKKTHYLRAAKAWDKVVQEGHSPETIIGAYDTSPRIVQATEAKHLPNPEAYLLEYVFLDPPVTPEEAGGADSFGFGFD